MRSGDVRHLRRWVRPRRGSSSCRGRGRDRRAPGRLQGRPRSSVAGRRKDVPGGKQQPSATFGDVPRSSSPPALLLTTPNAPSAHTDARPRRQGCGAAGGIGAVAGAGPAAAARWLSDPAAGPVNSSGCAHILPPQLFAASLLQYFNSSASQHHSTNKKSQRRPAKQPTPEIIGTTRCLSV